MNPHPARGARRAFAVTALACAIGVAQPNASAQDPATPAAQQPDDRLEEMKQVVRSLKIVAIDDQGKETRAILSEEPLHRWTDPTRNFHGGALWVWRASNRPVAVVGAELYTWWSLEFVSVTPGLVKADNEHVHWAPRKGGGWLESGDCDFESSDRRDCGERWHRPSRREPRSRAVPHAGAPAAGTGPPP